MNREEWLQERRRGLGGSDITAILGLSEYKTPYAVWEEKVLGVIPPENEFMKAGKKLEHVVAEYYEEATGETTTKPEENKIYCLNDNPIICGTPDRLLDEAVLELKTTQHFITADNFPTEWLLQGQWYAGILNKNYCINAWLTRGAFFDYRKTEFDKELFETLIESGTDWWNKYVVKNIKPEPVNSQDIIRMFKDKLTGNSVVLKSELLPELETLRELKNQKKQIEEKEKNLEENIKMIMRDNEYLVDSDNRTLATWKQNAKGTRTFSLKI